MYLNKALKRMNLVSSSMCPYCNEYDETPIHLFAECRYVSGVWGQIQLFFRSKVVLRTLTHRVRFWGGIRKTILGF